MHGRRIDRDRVGAVAVVPMIVCSDGWHAAGPLLSAHPSVTRVEVATRSGSMRSMLRLHRL